MILIFLSCANIALAFECHPTIDGDKNNYIVGYGSLMNNKSRHKTTPAAKEIYPILVKNYERVWGKRSSVKKATYLVIVPKKDQKFNAVYYKVDSKEIENTDQREKKYCRYKLSHRDISKLGNYALKKGTYWVYARQAKDIQKPTKSHPIIQSYVDIFISGCREVEKDFKLKGFTKQCIKTTHIWKDDKWQNDRDNPKRDLDIDIKKSTIDNALDKHL